IATGGGSDGGNAADVAAIPSFFYNKVLSERSRLGFSVTAPFGGGLDYGDDFVGRYSIQNVSLASLAFTPAYAYKVNDQLSLGIGVSFIYTTLEQEIAVRPLLPVPDGKAKFEDLSDSGYQAVLGLTYQPSSQTLVGVVYRSKADIQLEGTLKVTLGTGIPLADQNVRIDWENPQWLEVGVRHQLNDKQTLFFNLGWQDWSAFSRNELNVTSAGIVDVTDRKWDDTWHVGMAYAHKLNETNYYTLGLAYESSPVKDEYRTFDFPVDALWKLSGAYGWKGGQKLDFAVGATLYLVGDAPVDQTDQGVRAAGKFDTNSNLILGGTLRYMF
ncbi:MAG: outer membrane protein transport protein, partial [Pseudomonadota bacterium]